MVKNRKVLRNCGLKLFAVLSKWKSTWNSNLRMYFTSHFPRLVLLYQLNEWYLMRNAVSGMKLLTRLYSTYPLPFSLTKRTPIRNSYFTSLEWKRLKWSDIYLGQEADDGEFARWRVCEGGRRPRRDVSYYQFHNPMYWGMELLSQLNL